MIHAQLYLAQTPPNITAAREALSVAVKKCPTAVPLWIMSSQLEEKAGLRIKARALLEKARMNNPKSEEIWLESVKVEERDGSGAAKGLLARGEFQAVCPPFFLGSILTGLLFFSSSNSANIWSTALSFRLDRTATYSQNSGHRRPQEGQQLRARHRDRCSALLE